MRLAVIEVLDRDGHARQVVPVLQWPATIGRAIDCDVVLNDAHVAARHATILETDGQLSLQVGETVNGAELRGKRLPSGAAAELPSGETFQLGATRLRVRRAGDALAPELGLLPELPPGRVPLPVLVLAFFVWGLSAQWLITDPGGRLIDWVPILILPLVGITIWCVIWAIVSKIFRHRFEFWPHTRIAISYILATEFLGFLLPVFAFMIGWSFLSRVAGFVSGAVMCAMIVAHLTRVVPARRRAVAITMAGLYVAGTAVILTRNYQTQDRVFSELYVTTLAPPALRLAPTVESAQFIEEAKSLKAPLERHVNDQDGSDADLGDFDFTRIK